MAEYKKFSCPYGDECDRCEHYELCMKTPTADVIERSEYEYLKKENRELAIKYDNAMNMVINSDEQLEKLRSKVDKAIEELQHIKVYEHTRTARLVSLPEVLDVLKKHIGE